MEVCATAGRALHSVGRIGNIRRPNPGGPQCEARSFMTNPKRVIELSDQISTVAESKILEIGKITSQARILALNALIEAQRAYGMNSKVIQAGDQMLSTLTQLSV